MKLLISVLVVLTGTVGFFAKQSAAQNQKPRIGVLLPMSGPSGVTGLEALAVIRRRMSGAVELVVRDTQSSPVYALEEMKVLVERERVELIIGPLNAIELAVILSGPRILPVISLANASPSIAGNARKAGVVTFTQPAVQLKSVSNAIRENSKFLVMSTPFFAFKNDVIETSLPKSEISKTTIAIDKPDAISTLTKESAKSNVVIAAATDSLTAETLLRSLKAQDGKGVIVSPPPVQRTASVAADLALAWAKQPNRSLASWSELLARSPLYNNATGTLEVNWSVATRGVSYNPDASGTGTTSCSCSSKDKKTTHKNECTYPAKCVVTETQDDCSCDCE